MSTDARIYFTLAIVAALYAVLLHYTKDRLEPDFTWLEVVIGCVLCLGFAAWRARLSDDTTWQGYERGVWLAFLIGGGVIVAWQIGRAIWRQEELRKRGRTSAETMAEQRRGGPSGDD